MELLSDIYFSLFRKTDLSTTVQVKIKALLEENRCERKKAE